MKKAVEEPQLAMSTFLRPSPAWSTAMRGQKQREEVKRAGGEREREVVSIN